MDDGQIDDFKRDGFLLIRNFYDVETYIRPIQRDIHKLTRLMIEKYELNIVQPKFLGDKFDSCFQKIINFDRKIGSEIYDAIKQIPSFISLVGSPRNIDVFSDLRSGSLPGIASGGYGIRIDNPLETKYQTSWHQEYPGQLRSINGVTFWTPLLSITSEIGPVKICKGSHISGPLPVYTVDKENPNRSGAYALRLADEKSIVEKFQKTAPLLDPGDLLIMDFQLVHSTSPNTSNRSRWSIQMRYFDFNEPTGLSHGWKGSFNSGIDFRDIHPELCAD